MDTSLGFFSGFNARHMDAEQVAKSFVPGPKFTQLLALQNSLLVGARGSGKTHMLKMLQPKALNAWQHQDAESVRQSTSYWGIFVPADEAWRQQVDVATSELPADIQSRFRSAVFSTHVQRSVLDCFLQLTYDRPHSDAGFGRVTLNPKQESELCRTLATSWQLQPRIHSLIGIRQALVDRGADLYEAADQSTRLTDLMNSCQTQPVQAALRGLNAFDDSISRFGGRWALLFDELEIAPQEVQSILFRSLRSTDQKLIFKLALSPSTQAAAVFHEIGGPTAGNDFDEISLYSDPKEAAAFCESLWRSLSKGTSAEAIDPWRILGHSTFHAPETVNPYAKRGRWQEASSSLARKDETYSAFLTHYRLDPDALDKASPDLKNSVVRKIGPLVGFRNFMLKPVVGQRPTFRADKAKPALLYSGWEALCLASEGNPRWFTGIAKSLLIRNELDAKDLSKAIQYTAIVSASRKFMDYVATIPSEATSDLFKEGGLKSLIDLIAKEFRNDLLIAPFSLEPPSSFIVDKDTSSEIRKIIFDGLYAGAFIPIGDIDRQFAFSADLSEQRLRITYLLAPLEMLPLRTGKARSLKGMLDFNAAAARRARRIGRRTVVDLPEPQTRLFNE